MIGLTPILLFFFVFSTLIVLRTTTLFVMRLLSQIPTKMEMTKTELITNGVALSYIITYLIS